jgi:4-aminobutyrate aminotransferase/(S)-3-amino-2-methylpropionate transaminase
VVFIADEIQTGFARTGAMFACELFNVIPDLIVTAKGIAGGLPLAAVTGRIEIMDAAHVGGLGGTYGGNPVACAASLAAIETIKAENLVARAGEIERIMLTRLHRMQSDDNRIGDVRGRGAMIAVELVHRDTSDPDPAFTAAVAAAAREQGVIVLTCGTYGNVLRFLPPLAISDELLNEGLDVLAEAFASL